MSERINQDPMTVGKILDTSVNFIFRNILWIALIGFIASLSSASQFLTSGDSNHPFILVQYKLIFLVIGWVLSPFLTGMVTILLGEQFCGRKITWHQVVRKGVKKWIPLILLQWLMIIAGSLAAILLIIPGFIVICATACAIPAMILEDLGPTQAFERSWNLTRKNRFRIFGYLISTFVIAIIFYGIDLAVATQFEGDPLYKIGIATLVSSPFQALWPAITTLLYYDLRIRKEAMDLEEEAKTISVATEEIA